jgi:hypothetical protein
MTFQVLAPTETAVGFETERNARVGRLKDEINEPEVTS